jgi:hypothetical protein
MIPALRKLRQGDLEFKVSLDYIVDPVSKKKKNGRKCLFKQLRRG